MNIHDDRSVTLEEHEVHAMRETARLALVGWEYRKRLRHNQDADIQDMLSRVSDEDFGAMRKCAKSIKFSGIWREYDK